MFGFDWPELIIIGIVALVFIGPEDLPDMFRQLGRFTAKLRSMSREFSRAMEQAAKDTGVKDVHTDLKGMTSAKSLGLDAVKNAADSFEKWDPLKNAAKPSMTSMASMPARSLVPPPMPATPVAASGSSLVSAAERDAAPDDAAPDDAGEAEDDLAAHAEVVNTIHGPATQALYDKQALRAQVLAEQTEKLKAIEAGTYVAPAAAAVQAVLADPAPEAAAVIATPPMAVVAAPRKRATKAKADAVVEAATKSPAKATRKPAKKADKA